MWTVIRAPCAVSVFPTALRVQSGEYFISIFSAPLEAEAEVQMT